MFFNDMTVLGTVRCHIIRKALKLRTETSEVGHYLIGYILRGHKRHWYAGSQHVQLSHVLKLFHVDH